MEEDGLSGLRDFDFVFSKIFMLAGIAFKMTRASIRALRVLAAVMRAKKEECLKAHEFAKEFGTHSGYLQIKTEDAKALQHFEQRMKFDGVEYARLPNLQPGGGNTQYMYNLDKLDSLKASIQTYEEDRLTELQNLKQKYGDSDRYQTEKQKLQEEMPDIELITVDDYAKTAYKDGQETEAFQEVKESAKEAEKEDILKNPQDSSDYDKEDIVLVAALAEFDKKERIENGTLVSIEPANIAFDSIQRNGSFTEVANIQLRNGRYTLVLPKSAVQDDGTVLIDKTKSYPLIENKNRKISNCPAELIENFMVRDAAKKQTQTAETKNIEKAIELPEKTRRRGR